MTNVPPCKNCVERHTACHGSCDKYKIWYEWQTSRKQQYKESVIARYNPWSHAREKAARKKKSKYSRYGYNGE